MGEKEVRKTIDKLHHNIKFLGHNYFIDTDAEKIGDSTIDYWKIVMGAFTYIGKKNALLIGEPGEGKTTFSNVISSVFSCLPFDLFETLQIQGHPDQTKDTMMARTDIGKLLKDGIEDVVWQASVYLPALTLDEFNWIPQGKQSIVQEFIRTGTIEHLGQVLPANKIPFFATVNYNGNGSYELTRKILDRFDISLEFPKIISEFSEYIEGASKNISRDLRDEKLSREIRQQLLSKKMSAEEKFEFLNKKRKQYSEHIKKIGFEVISDEELAELRKYADSIKFDKDATMFTRSMLDEANFSEKYGSNRKVDPREKSSHNSVLLNSAINGGISYRGQDAIRYFGRAVAAFMGDASVSMNHLNGTRIIIDTLAHRIDITEDYKAKFAAQARLKGEREDADLTRRLVYQAKQNYDAISSPLINIDFISGKLNSGKALDKKDEETVQSLLKPITTDGESAKIDHPYLKHSLDILRSIYEKYKKNSK